MKKSDKGVVKVNQNIPWEDLVSNDEACGKVNKSPSIEFRYGINQTSVIRKNKECGVAVARPVRWPPIKGNLRTTAGRCGLVPTDRRLKHG